MTLGQKITDLRSRRGLSQEALANMLGVSRQSVSKWETDASVPELDKLIKLSQVFGVTLDELVNGSAGAESGADGPQYSSDNPTAANMSLPSRGSKAMGVIFLSIGGVIFLWLAIYGAGLGGLAFALPFLAAGLLCLLLKRKRVGLWCSWALLFLVELYLSYATGVSWAIVRLTLHFSAHMNSFSLVIGWLIVAARLGLMVATVLSFRRLPMANSRGLIAPVALSLAFTAVRFILSFSGLKPLGVFPSLLCDFAGFAALTWLLTDLLRLFRRRRA